MTTQTTLIGAVLDGRYKIDDRLGAGGMAEVYLATDQRLLDRKVAVKVPHASLLAEFGFKERFKREMDSLIRLDHPRIVKVLDAGEHQGIPYVIMQYLAGGSLRERLGGPGNRCTTEDVLTWLPAVAEGLDFLHSEDVIHRDVKPANILFDQSGNAFIADFGIAKLLGSVDVGLTVTGTTPGTPFYMGPEISTGEPITGAYDQYALATMTYKALAGERPFDADTPMRLLFMKASDQPPSITKVAKDLPSGLAAAIARGLSRTPAERFLCCESFARSIATNAPTQFRTNATIPLNDLRELAAANPQTAATLEPTETQLATAGPANSRRLLIPVLSTLFVLAGAAYGTYHFGLWPNRQASWVAPSLVSCTPAHGATITETEFKVSGVASVNLRSVTVNGKTAVVAGKTFEIRVRAEPPGFDANIELISVYGESVEYPYQLFIERSTQRGPAGNDPSTTIGTPTSGTPTSEFPASGITPGTTSGITTSASGSTPTTALRLASANPEWDEVVGREFTLEFETTRAIRRASVMGTDAKVVDGHSVSVPVRLTASPGDGTAPQRHFIQIDLVDENGELRSFRHAVRADLAGPAIETIDPDHGATPGTAAQVIATVSEPLAAARIGGKPATIDDNKLGFAADLEVPEIGLEVEIELEDRFGNKKSTMYRLGGTADWKLTNFTPRSRSGESFLMRGESSKPLRAVQVDGQPAKLGTDQASFSLLVAPSEAPREFVVEMIDSAGGRKTVKRTIGFDLVPPVLLQSNPANGATVDSRFAFTGTADETLVQATVDGRDCKVAGKKFSIDMVMPGANHTAEIKLVDRQQNESIHRLALKGDTSELRVDVSPANRTKLTAPVAQLKIAGNRHLTKVAVNGKQLPRLAGQPTIHRLELAPGANKVSITAEDGFGNRTVVERIYEFNDPKKALEFSSDLSLSVKIRLQNGAFATRGRVASGRPPIRIRAHESWMIEPEIGLFDNRTEFAKLVNVLRESKVPALSLRNNRSKSCDLLTKLPNLEILILDQSLVGKNGLASLVSLTGLKSLTLIKNDVRGRDLYAIGNIHNLEHLHLEKLGKVKPADLGFLRSLTKLKTLVIRGLRIQGNHIAALNLPKTVKVTVTR